MLDLTINFAVAVFIGALVGIERERKKAEENPSVAFGGIRTFILISLTGALSAWLSIQLKTVWIFITASFIVSSFVLVAYILENRTLKRGALGLTSEAAAIIVFLLGGTTLFGYKEIAVALGIATAAALAYKKPLHSFVGKIYEDDIYAGLTLLFATFIVLPVLPNKTVDPLSAINPYKVWILVILISGLSLVGYVVTRWLGEKKGTLLTGLFGGMVSSTAVTLAFSRQTRESEGTRVMHILAASLLIAWSVMFIRVLVAIIIVNISLFKPLLIPMIVMAVLAAVTAFIYYRGASAQSKEGSRNVPLKNPFSLISALKFGLLFVIVLLLVKYVQRNFSPTAFYYVAALAGLTDVDAITLSMAGYVKSGGDSKIAVSSITIAALTNTLAKCGFVILLGQGKVRLLISIATLVILSGGVIAMLFFM